MSNSTPTAVQAVQFILSGGGDTVCFLAPPSALAWCEQVKRGSRTLPRQVAADLDPFMDPFMDPDSLAASITDEVHITAGSSDNDAALFWQCQRCVLVKPTHKANLEALLPPETSPMLPNP